MKTNKLFISMVISVSALLTGCATLATMDSSDSSYVTSSPYQVRFAQPDQKHWTKTSESDSNGYLITYTSNDANNAMHQIIKLNYAKGIHTSLMDSMQQVSNTTAAANCQTHGMKILDKGKSFVSFESILDQCPTGNSMTSVYKFFSQPDGQYSLTYTVNPHVVSPDTMKGMTKMITKATIFRNAVYG